MPKKVINLSSNAEFWDFEKQGLFTGYYVRDHFNSEDGKLMGFLMENEIGETWIIPGNYSIEKALEQEIDGLGLVKNIKDGLITVEYKGKKQLKNGRDFALFNVSIEIPDEEPEPVKKSGTDKSTDVSTAKAKDTEKPES